MPAEFVSRARADYQRARRKAFLNRIWSVVSGQPAHLLSYDEVREKLHIGGPVYRGMQTIRIDRIAGSLNRYHQFDRAFLPTQDENAGRWQRVDRAYYS
ncbi:transcriptional regulator, partial [bacterium]|nr:transcriptional regulator [bacterium]